MKSTLVRLCIALLLTAGLTDAASGQTPDDPLQAGWVVVTHESPLTDELAVFETFGFSDGGETTQAGVLSSVMTTAGMIVVTANDTLGRDLGLAIVNPQNASATVNLTLRDASGNVVGNRSLDLPPLNQTAQFVSQIFSGVPEIGDFAGTLTYQSTLPVAAVGLRFRGQNFSTIPITPLAAVTAVPPLAGGAGGPGAFILPQFAVGDGWASEIVVMNYSATNAHDVQVDLYSQAGTPMTVNLNGQTASTFPLATVQPGGVLILSTRDASGNSPF